MHAPRFDRAQIFAVVGFVSVAVIVWVAFELGQIRAGHNSFEADERYGELQVERDEKQRQNQELRERVARLETDRKIDGEGYARVEGELKSLEAQILTLQEDLEFYRGIVADQQAGVRVQDFVVWPGDDALSYSIRLVLAQEMRAGSRISGYVELEVEGMQNSEQRTLNLAELAAGGGGKKRLDFSFRYFQNLEVDLILPEGFAPSQVNVKLRPRGKSAKTVNRTFNWDVKAG